MLITLITNRAHKSIECALQNGVRF